MGAHDPQDFRDSKVVIDKLKERRPPKNIHLIPIYEDIIKFRNML